MDKWRLCLDPDCESSNLDVGVWKIICRDCNNVTTLGDHLAEAGIRKRARLWKTGIIPWESVLHPHTPPKGVVS